MITNQESLVRAPKGGIVGVNGEFYNGGEFLPSSPYTSKGEFRRNHDSQGRPKKEEVAAFKWIQNHAEAARVEFERDTGFSKRLWSWANERLAKA